MHGEMVLESELRGKDWVSKSEYLSFLKREHYDLWRTVISMLAADEAVEGESGPSVPEAVIPLGWHPPVRTMSRRWRLNTLWYEVLKLLLNSIETLFAKFEEEQTLKKAMVRNLRTVLRPNITEGKFEKITEQSWAQE